MADEKKLRNFTYENMVELIKVIANGVKNNANPNILRGTNSYTEIEQWTYPLRENLWEDGSWQSYEMSTPEIIDITDAPIQDINVGLNLEDSQGIIQTDVPVEIGKTYTMSCYVKGEGHLTLIYYTGYTFVQVGQSISSDSWKTISTHFISQIDTQQIAFAYSSGSLKMCGMKLEEGSSATAWCPSYWDMENKYLEDKIPTKVSELENDANFATILDIPTKTSELENDSGYITETDLTAPNANILRGTNTCKQLSSDNSWDSNGFCAYISNSASTSIDIDNAPVSGINIGWEISSNQSAGIYQTGIPTLDTNTYTVSCYARGEGNLVIGELISTTGANIKTYNISSSDWEQCSYSSSGTGFNIIGPLWGCSSGTIEICGMKLEKGTIATAWCPSYYDMENQYNIIRYNADNKTLSFI